MSEQEPKQPKQTKEYFTRKARERRIKDKKCAVCGAMAWGKIYLTQESRCDKCMVAPLKASLLSKVPKKEENKNEQTQNPQ